MNISLQSLRNAYSCLFLWLQATKKFPSCKVSQSWRVETKSEQIVSSPNWNSLSSGEQQTTAGKPGVGVCSRRLVGGRRSRRNSSVKWKKSVLIRPNITAQWCVMAIKYHTMAWQVGKWPCRKPLRHLSLRSSAVEFWDFCQVINIEMLSTIWGSFFDIYIFGG